MKKIIFSLSTLLASAVLFTGCLKDKGYDNQEYGIKDPSGMSRGISIPEASEDLNNINEKALALDALTTPQTVALFDVNFESDQPAPTDIGVNLALNPTLVSSFNSQQGTSYVSLPSSAYTVNLKVTIKAGQRTGTLAITVPNAGSLSATQTYALGFTIASVDQSGYTIASNLKNIMISFNIKNKYDGVYRLYGSFSRSDLPTYVGVNNSPTGYYEPYNLITSGPNSVNATIETSTYGTTNTQIIYVTGSGFTYFTGVAPKLTIDASNNVTVSEGAAAVGTSVPFLQSAAELAASKYYPTGIPGLPTSSYASGKKAIVAHFRWSSGGIDRITKDTFVYKGPR